MKRKILSIIITFCFTQLFSQQIQFWRFPSFLIDVNYEIIQDCYSVIYDENDKEYKTTDLKLKKRNIYSIDIYEEHFGIDLLAIDDKNLVDSKNYKIENNDIFPEYCIYSNIKRETENRWVPVWYFDALKKQDRDLILNGEFKRKSWDGDISPDVWYKDIPQVSSFVLSNSGMGIYTPLIALCIFKFQSVKKISDTEYEVVAYPDVEATDNDITWDIYKENFPHIENGNPVKFIIEINGKEMKVYNGETKKICFDLIQVSAEWVKLYERFIRTNNVPAGLELPKEYLERSNKK
ncbi:MAG: hypothetical protein IIW71_10870 [Treponema sp.]|nr:hypothetical protein [Treponema sp.]